MCAESEEESLSSSSDREEFEDCAGVCVLVLLVTKLFFVVGVICDTDSELLADSELLLLLGLL